jgi:hypothetical protein
VLAGVGAFTGHVLRGHEATTSAWAGLAFGAIDFAIAGAIALALGLSRRSASVQSEVIA